MTNPTDPILTNAEWLSKLLWSLEDDYRPGESDVVDERQAEVHAELLAKLSAPSEIEQLLMALPLSRRKEVGTTRLKWKHYYLTVTAGHSTGSWVAGYRAASTDRYERQWFGSASGTDPASALRSLRAVVLEQGILGEKS